MGKDFGLLWNPEGGCEVGGLVHASPSPITVAGSPRGRSTCRQDPHPHRPPAGPCTCGEAAPLHPMGAEGLAQQDGREDFLGQSPLWACQLWISFLSWGLLWEFPTRLLDCKAISENQRREEG